jgi:hypothetical protein
MGGACPLEWSGLSPRMGSRSDDSTYLGGQNLLGDRLVGLIGLWGQARGFDRALGTGSRTEGDVIGRWADPRGIQGTGSWAGHECNRGGTQ